MDNVISVQQISVAYGKVNVLEDVSFEVKAGEFIAIIGKSGSGKTSLLNTLAGFIKYKGRVTTHGKIGFCYQNHSLFYWMTVAENIGFGLKDDTNKKDIVKSILQKIGMSDLGQKYPAELSGGQVQRVALGRAIAGQPGIIFLDEPFSSLDIYTRDQMMDWMLKIIATEGSTFMMVTHYLDEALLLADRIFVLKEKKIVAEIPVPFGRSRTQAIRFTPRFQEYKQQLADLLNQP